MTHDPITLETLHELARQAADKGGPSAAELVNLTATLDRLYSIQDAAIAWARTERLADDLAANRHAVSRKIGAVAKPVPTDLLEEATAVDQALHRVCVAENDAEQHLKNVARQLLDADPVTPSVQREACTNMAPPGYSGHWRAWHRGHGCHLDDTPPPKVTPPIREASSWRKATR